MKRQVAKPPTLSEFEQKLTKTTYVLRLIMALTGDRTFCFNITRLRQCSPGERGGNNRKMKRKREREIKRFMIGN